MGPDGVVTLILSCILRHPGPGSGSRVIWADPDFHTVSAVMPELEQYETLMTHAWRWFLPADVLWFL